jgi:hypothetical protein
MMLTSLTRRSYQGVRDVSRQGSVTASPLSGVEGEQTGREYFKRMYDYLEDFHGHLLEIKSGRRSADEVADHMLSGN